MASKTFVNPDLSGPENPTHVSKTFQNPSKSMNVTLPSHVTPEILEIYQRAVGAKDLTGDALEQYQNDLSASQKAMVSAVRLIRNTSGIASGTTSERDNAIQDIKKGLAMTYADSGMSAEEIGRKLSEMSSYADYAMAVEDTGVMPPNTEPFPTESWLGDGDFYDRGSVKVYEEAVNRAVNYYDLMRTPDAYYAVYDRKTHKYDPSKYFDTLDETLSIMGDTAVHLNDLNREGLNENNRSDYANTIRDMQYCLATMYKYDHPDEDVNNAFEGLRTFEDYVEAAREYGDRISNAKERIKESQADREERDWDFDGEWYTAPDGRQLSRDNYVLLCNVVAHEAGLWEIPVEEKAKCVAGIMTRCGGNTDNISGVVGDPSQFEGNAAYVERTDFTDGVTADVEAAVKDYFCYPEKYDNKHIYFWYGDGEKNYFTRSNNEHEQVAAAVRRGDRFAAHRLEYESEDIQRTSNREQLGRAGFDIPNKKLAKQRGYVDFIDYGNEESTQLAY